MPFKVTEQRLGQGAMGAGELNPADATHKFTAKNNDGELLFAGVTDGQDHDGLRKWATAAHGAQVEFSKGAPAAKADDKAPADKK